MQPSCLDETKEFELKSKSGTAFHVIYMHGLVILSHWVSSSAESAKNIDFLCTTPELETFSS